MSYWGLADGNFMGAGKPSPSSSPYGYPTGPVKAGEAIPDSMTGRHAGYPAPPTPEPSKNPMGVVPGMPIGVAPIDFMPQAKENAFKTNEFGELTGKFTAGQEFYGGPKYAQASLLRQNLQPFSYIINDPTRGDQTLKDYFANLPNGMRPDQVMAPTSFAALKDFPGHMNIAGLTALDNFGYEKVYKNMAQDFSNLFANKDFAKWAETGTVNPTNPNEKFNQKNVGNWLQDSYSQIIDKLNSAYLL